jgi:glycosyltransferase involved in cell wall biosynthesis
MSLTVLSVAFPFAPVGRDPVGGAEQVLRHIDRALVAAGHRSLVVAEEGSQIAGTLISIPAQRGLLSEASREMSYRSVRETLGRVLQAEPVDVVHMHGFDFHSYLPAAGPPVLVTLHLPLEWYPAGVLDVASRGVWLQPVSSSQASRARCTLKLLTPIENGVDLECFPRVRKRSFALVLGRVCPEKGFHDALDAARQAEVPLLAAGAVFPWPEHQHYFESEIVPRLDGQRRWIGALAGYRKRWLLAAARCVLMPSHVCETSSLVAMEALAAGTPVIAYDSGALPTIVDHEVTGYIVGDCAEMAQAIRRTELIDPEICRRAARERFSLQRCMSGYLQLYEHLAHARGKPQGPNLESTTCQSIRATHGPAPSVC